MKSFHLFREKIWDFIRFKTETALIVDGAGLGSHPRSFHAIRLCMLAGMMNHWLPFWAWQYLAMAIIGLLFLMPIGKTELRGQAWTKIIRGALIAAGIFWLGQHLGAVSQTEHTRFLALACFPLLYAAAGIMELACGRSFLRIAAEWKQLPWRQKFLIGALAVGVTLGVVFVIGAIYVKTRFPDALAASSEDMSPYRQPMH